MKNLPVINLDQLEIASPCDADWDNMRGDERKRFCDDCSLHVFNFSEMTELEIRQLLRDAGHERVCGQLHRRHDGTVIVQDCPVGLAARTWKKARNTSLLLASSLAAVITLVLAGFAWFMKPSGCDVPVLDTPPVVEPIALDEVVMGKIAIEEPPPPPKPQITRGRINVKR